MSKLTSYLWALAPAAGLALVIGCQAPQQRADIQQIPEITRLVEKATATPRVQRFRKPLRDEQMRILRQLAIECDRLASSYRGDAVTAEALTGTVSERAEAARTDTETLETALGQLAAAAHSGDIRAIRSNHSAALTAYARVQSRTAQPDP